MSLIVYTRANDGVGGQLQKMIEKLVPQNNIEVYRSIDSLSHRLRQPADDMAVAILLASNRGDLLDILSIRDLLRNIRIILVLPDREDDTIAKGHSLRPRFLSYTDNDFVDVCAVLAKML